MRKKDFAIFSDAIAEERSQTRILSSDTFDANFDEVPYANKLRKTPSKQQLVFLCLTSIGSLVLLGAYATSSVILTFIGLGSIFWGVLFLYVVKSAVVDEEIFVALPLSLTKTIDRLVTESGYRGKAIFFHPASLRDQENGYIFIPHEEGSRITNVGHLSTQTMWQENPKGILLKAPSQSMAKFLEDKMNINNAPSKDSFAYLQENLPELMIEELRITDDAILDYDENSATCTFRMSGGPSTRICKSIDAETSIGCPLCGALALILSRINGKPVRIVQTIANDNSVQTKYQYLDDNVL